MSTEHFEYIDKDDYYFENKIKNIKIHKTIVSTIILIYLFITYKTIRLLHDNENPRILIIFWGILSLLFYLNYFSISVFITNFISVFYIKI